MVMVVVWNEPEPSVWGTMGTLDQMAGQRLLIDGPPVVGIEVLHLLLAGIHLNIEVAETAPGPCAG